MIPRGNFPFEMAREIGGVVGDGTSFRARAQLSACKARFIRRQPHCVVVGDQFVKENFVGVKLGCNFKQRASLREIFPLNHVKNNDAAVPSSSQLISQSVVILEVGEQYIESVSPLSLPVGLTIPGVHGNPQIIPTHGDKLVRQRFAQQSAVGVNRSPPSVTFDFPANAGDFRMQQRLAAADHLDRLESRRNRIEYRCVIGERHPRVAVNFSRNLKCFGRLMLKPAHRTSVIARRVDRIDAEETGSCPCPPTNHSGPTKRMGRQSANPVLFQRIA